jgi:WD40 repeat protein
MFLIRTACILCLLAGSAGIIHAQQSPAKDANDGPLPPGAIARIGSPRFRVPGPLTGVRFVGADERHLLVRVKESAGSFPSEKGSFRLIDTATALTLGTMPLEFDRHPDWAVSPDGALIAKIEWPSRLRVDELRSQKTVFELHEHLQFVQFFPDGKKIAVIAVNNSPERDKEKPPLLIRVFDLQTQKEVREFLPPPRLQETFQPHWFMFSPDGSLLAATGFEGGKAGIVRVWEVTGERPSWILEGQSDKRDQTRAIAFSPDGKTLAATHHGMIRLWDAATGKRQKDIADLPGYCTTIDFSPDGKRLIANYKGAAEIDLSGMWEVATGKEISLPMSGEVSYTFSANGEHLVLEDTKRGRLLLCAADTGKVAHTFDYQVIHNGFAVHDENTSVMTRYYHARQGMGWPFTFSADGKTLIACERAGQIRRFDTNTGKEFAAAGAQVYPAPLLAFAPDGKKLLAVGKGFAVFHDLADGTSALSLPIDHSADPKLTAAKSLEPNALAYSSDGKSAAVGWDNGMIDLWETATGKRLWQTRDHQLSVSSLMFAPDDQTLLSAGNYDGRVIWWNAATGQVQRTLVRDQDRQLFHRGHFWIGPNGRSALYRHETFEEIELSSRGVRRQFSMMEMPLAITPDGKYFLMSNWGCYRLIDSVNGAEVRSFGHVDSMLHSRGIKEAPPGSLFPRTAAPWFRAATTARWSSGMRPPCSPNRL